MDGTTWSSGISAFAKTPRSGKLDWGSEDPRLIFFRYLEQCIYLGFQKNQTKPIQKAVGHMKVGFPLWSSLLWSKCLAASWARVRRACVLRGVTTRLRLPGPGHSAAGWAEEGPPFLPGSRQQVSLRICIKSSEIGTDMKSLTSAGA